MATSPFSVDSIAIIGAGPSGLAAAKYLQGQGAFGRIVVYEERSEVGGVWNYSPEPTPVEHIPQVSAYCAPDPPIRPGNGSGDCAPVFPSPMYETLHTNLQHSIMRYSDLPFSAVAPAEGELLLFPRRQTVQDYLVRYAQEVRGLIRLCTTVEDVRLVQGASVTCDRWEVHTSSTTDTSRTRSVETFDALVVASGHYDVPFVPDVPGLREFHAAHPGVVMHAKRYRRAAAFSGKKVVVVGNAASGIDVASQVQAVSQIPLLLSGHGPAKPAFLFEQLLAARCEQVPEIVEFLPAERGVRFANGRVERDVDTVIYCTGYLYGMPFLEREAPRPAEAVAAGTAGGCLGERLLAEGGNQVMGIYEDIFHISHPTLAFIGLLKKVAPFPVSETQAALVARVWANALRLPSAEEMRAKEAAKDPGPPKLHVWLGPVDDGIYINKTYERIMHGEGGAAAAAGKEPPRWGPEQMWERSIAWQAKSKFDSSGRKATSLAEVGFVFGVEANGEANGKANAE